MDLGDLAMKTKERRKTFVKHKASDPGTTVPAA